MSTKVIHSGQTFTLPLTSLGASNLVVEGGYPGKSEGYLLLNGSGTLGRGHFLLAQGGLPAYAGASPREGGTVALGGTLTNAGTIAIAGGYLGTYGVGISEPGGGGALFRDRGVLNNTGLLIVDGAVTAGPFTASQSGTFDLVGVLMNTGTISLSIGTPANPASMGVNGGLLSVSGTLTNDGLITVQTIRPHPGSSDRGYGSGLISVAQTGTLLNAGTIVLAGGINSEGLVRNIGVIELQGGGPGHLIGYTQSVGYGAGIDIEHGPSIATISVLSNSGTLSFGGGAGGTAAQPLGGEGASGFVSDYASLTNTGVINFSGGGAGAGANTYGGGGSQFTLYGTLTNTGLIDVGAGLSPTGAGGVGTNARFEIGGTDPHGVLTNAGTILLNSNSADLPSFSTYSLVLENFEDQLILTGGSIIGAGTIFSFGTITGTGTITGGSLDNDGTVIAGTGVLTIDEQISSRGTFVVGSGATLSLAGSVAIDQSGDPPDYQIVMLNAAGVLDLTSGTAGIEIVTPNGGTAELLGGGAATLYAVDTDLTINLMQTSTLTLSKAGFVTAIGSSGNDSITALASEQTLTGGLGVDTLIGAASTGDTFRDTGAGLNGDTIGGFAGSDVIDIIDFAPGAGATLSFAQNGPSGALTVRDGGLASTITLLGTFAIGDFVKSSDGAGGLMIGLHG